ncbi:hypothetical protein L6164_036702 [Bauhinia variegata]|uniref:Uncharacterized protein n=1 Tax=Bauhinia variegata TaxID=167791 RepID=A0ACB9KHX2_BAUVA|nr:hypothetical protein L6164_036702 [Bauhinia variegata]
MPAQKRLHEGTEEGALGNEKNNDEQPEDELETVRSSSGNKRDNEEYVVIKLSDVRKEVQCPICLGIIRKTRTVMECLHRFCRECIDKSMRLGNNECPACRTHCASRRSLRDDPNYDALIAVLYPDIDKYEEEEYALHEDERAQNKQIQASIAQTLRRQTEALSKKRNAKATAVAFVRRSQGTYRTSHSRVRRRVAVNLEGSSDSDDAIDNDGSKGPSSGDEQTETRLKRTKRGGEVQCSQNSAAGADGAGEENVPEANREIMGPSGTLAWGKNGQRSHTRVNGKNTRNNRISKLVDHLRNSEKTNDELGIHLMLVSFDEQRIPSLQQPYLCCRPKLSVRHLCKYVSRQTAMQANEVELSLVKEQQANIKRAAGTVNPCKDKLQVLGEQEILAELETDNLSCGHLLMTYKRKLWNSKEVDLRGKMSSHLNHSLLST